MRYAWPLGILVSVILTYFSFPPYALGPVMFVALAPLFHALDEAPSARAAFFRCWCYVFVGNAAICFWVAHTVRTIAGLPWIVGFGAVLLLSAVEQLAWPLMAALRFEVHRRAGARPWLWTPLALVVLDATLPKVFPDTMGVVFYRVGFLRQLADVGGIWTLTALIVLSNETIALAWREGWRATKREIAIALGVFALAFGYGTWRELQVQRRIAAPVNVLRFALIQPNVNPYEALAHSFLKDTARVQLAAPLFERSYAALVDKPDLIVWPETAVASPYHGERGYPPLTEAIDKLADAGAPLLFGAREWNGDQVYNAAFLIDGHWPQVYRKTHLLAWGEWVPFALQWRWWRHAAESIGAMAFSAGPDTPQLFTLGHWKLGPYICFEALFPWYIRGIVRAGADVLVNLTNDAWFGEGGGPELHFALSRFRAIETRRPVVRVASTGYSAVIDIDGNLREVTSLGRPATLLAAVPVYEPVSSPFLSYGPWIAAAAVVWVLAAPFIFAFFV